MTDIEYAAIKELASCSFLPATFDKRIARKWLGMAECDFLKPMTDKGRILLWKLVWKYRRQIQNEAVLSYMLAVSEHPKAQEAFDREFNKAAINAAQGTLF